MKIYTKRKLVEGIGYNDVEYLTSQRENTCPILVKWKSMLRRCNKNIKDLPTYVDCLVEDKWKRFSNFKNWIEKQGDFENLTLDKDLLYPGNKIYGEAYCCLIPHRMNAIINLSVKGRGQYPYGVTFNKKSPKLKFSASICWDKSKSYIGSYETQDAAHKIWQEYKISQLNDCLSEYKFLPCYRKDVEEAFKKRIIKISLDLLLSRETLDLLVSHQAEQIIDSETIVKALNLKPSDESFKDMMQNINLSVRVIEGVV